jgi:predicted nucleotidyltransferase
LHELLSLLNSHGLDFIVVGAHALAYHGVPRFTEDVDFFIARNQENIERLAGALGEFGIPMSKEAQREMGSKERGMIFIGVKPNRADFLNFLSGVDFDLASKSKVAGTLAGEPVNYLSLEDYIATKKASGRIKDQADLTLLQSARPDIKI